MYIMVSGFFIDANDFVASKDSHAE